MNLPQPCKGRKSGKVHGGTQSFSAPRIRPALRHWASVNSRLANPRPLPSILPVAQKADSLMNFSSPSMQCPTEEPTKPANHPENHDSFTDHCSISISSTFTAEEKNACSIDAMLNDGTCEACQ